MNTSSVSVCDTHAIRWADGWTPLDDERRHCFLERELAWELADNDGHPLAMRAWEVVGWRAGSDDVIVRLDEADEYAFVQLAWNRDNRPLWPHCQVLGGADRVSRFLQHPAD